MFTLILSICLLAVGVWFYVCFIRLKKVNVIVCKILLQNKAEVFRPIFLGRIGHLAGEVDLFLKERMLKGNLEKPFALIACENTAANPHLLSYYREKFNFIISPSIWNQVIRENSNATQLLVDRPDYYVAINDTAKCYSIYSAWAGRKPIFTLRNEDHDFLRAKLRKWSVPDNAWIVCLHNREPGYSTRDDDLHAYRNADILTYLPAIQRITERGGWVIRMGDPSMTPLPPLPQVVDYVHTNDRSPRLDICLCASAKFFLGTSSGLFIVSTMFGVPTALANMTPSSAEAFTPSDLKISKLVATADGSLLSFRETMDSPAANFRFTEEFRMSGIKVISNSSDEILALTEEMLDRLDGCCVYTQEDERLQDLYRALLRPGHYGFGSSARTGRDFLRKHRALLQ